MIRRGVLAGLLGAGLGAGLGGCGAGGRLDGLAAGERGKVTDVRSGETLVLDSGLVVRLTGIEAPNGAEPYAREARAMLVNLVMGQPVSLFYGGARRDQYDRALAHVRCDEDRMWLQEALLRAGFARVHTWPDNRALARPMLGFEAHARQKGRGLWTLPGQGVLLPREAANRRGFMVVEGRVRSTAREGARTRLTFTEGGVEPLLAPGALPEAAMPGRIVRVRGWAGRDLVVDHAEAVELIRNG